MTLYTTRERDRLDLVCWRHYGHLTRTVERVLHANPHLAAAPPWLPAGIVIRLPELPPPPAARIRLW